MDYFVTLEVASVHEDHYIAKNIEAYRGLFKEIIKGGESFDCIESQI